MSEQSKLCRQASLFVLSSGKEHRFDAVSLFSFILMHAFKHLSFSLDLKTVFPDYLFLLTRCWEAASVTKLPSHTD